ncbi:MAG: helix-turn-helix domain-containing protein, partial [Burkholderiales bacterium]
AGRRVGTAELQPELDLENLEVELPGLAVGQDFKAVLDAAKRHLQLHKNFSLDNTLAQWERGYIEAALLITQGNLTQAAKMLGIHRTTLYSRMQSYGETAGAATAPQPVAKGP